MNTTVNNDSRTPDEIAAAAASLIRMLATGSPSVREAAEAALYHLIMDHWDIVYAEMRRAGVRMSNPAPAPAARAWAATRPRESLRLVR